MTDKKFTLELTKDELNFVLSALGKRPYEEAFQVIHSIQAQAQEQLQESGSSTNELQ